MSKTRNQIINTLRNLNAARTLVYTEMQDRTLSHSSKHLDNAWELIVKLTNQTLDELQALDNTTSL